MEGPLRLDMLIKRKINLTAILLQVREISGYTSVIMKLINLTYD